MQQLIIEKDLSPLQMDALINLLKEWNIGIKVKKYNDSEINLDEVSLLSQDALAQDWLTEEEDKAWQNL
jgi:hypothetical protein